MPRRHNNFLLWRRRYLKEIHVLICVPGRAGLAGWMRGLARNPRARSAKTEAPLGKTKKGTTRDPKVGEKNFLDIFYVLDAARALVPVATLVLEVAENTLPAAGSPESVSGG
jgi:hypothetical protein